MLELVTPIDPYMSFMCPYSLIISPITLSGVVAVLLVAGLQVAGLQIAGLPAYILNHQNDAVLLLTMTWEATG